MLLKIRDPIRTISGALSNRDGQQQHPRAATEEPQLGPGLGVSPWDGSLGFSYPGRAEGGCF